MNERILTMNGQPDRPEGGYIMKKWFAMMLCMMLAMTAASFAEENLFETLAGMSWSFSSGAGGWSTDLEIHTDGSFTGEYHDSEMGDYTDDYPYGTVYFCSFRGRMSVTEKADENSWRIRVDELILDPGEEMVADGIRYLPAPAYGLSEGDEMLLYRPGTPVGVLSEEMQMWAHLMDQETPSPELEDWFLSSEANGSGFVGYQPVFMPNPWEELTEEGLKEVSGLSFRVPEGAENVIYRFLRSDGLAEMQFKMFGDEFCARIQQVELEAGQLMNISGMYFQWENEEPVSIGGCSGTIGQAQTGTEEWVELCMWYDAERKQMHSLSVHTTDPDGLDLTAVAEQTLAD